MSRKYLDTGDKKLVSTVNSTQNTILINNLYKHDGITTVSAVEFGDLQYFVINPGKDGSHEVCSATGFSVDTLNRVTLTGVTRSLNGVVASHSSGAKVVFSNPKIFYDQFANINNENTFAEKQTFSKVPASTEDATTSNDLVRYSQLQAAVFGSLTSNPLVIKGDAGETLAIDELVYLNTADERWYKADADIASSVENVVLAITRGAGTTGNAITNGLTVLGLHTFSTAALTADKLYYASNTAGQIVHTTPGTKEVTVGVSRSTTELLFIPRFNQQLTEDEQDALLGSRGTPKASNKFITENDTTNVATITATTISFTSGTKTISDSNSGFVTAGFRAGQTITVAGSVSNNSTFTIVSVTSGAIVVEESLTTESAGASITVAAAIGDRLVRLNADGSLPQLSAINLTNSPGLTVTLTADGEISQNEMITVNSSGEATRVQPTAISAASATANADTNVNVKIVRLSHNKVLHLDGGDFGGGASFNAQVLQLNDAEDDVTKGTAYTIFATTARYFDAVEIGTDKVLVSWMTTSNNLRASVLSISGTTITEGSEVVVATGSNAAQGVALAKLSDDKAIAIYSDDSSDNDVSARVLNVSGTTITQGAEVVVFNGSTFVKYISASRISATKAVVIFTHSSNVYGYVLTVSGDVITVGTQNNIAAASWENIVLKMASETRGILISDRAGSNLIANGVSISADTISLSSNYTWGARVTSEYTIDIDVSGNYCVIAGMETAETNVRITALNIKDTTSTPTIIGSAQNVTVASVGDYKVGVAMVKPGVYVIGCEADLIIAKLTFPENQIAVANANVADNASGTFTLINNELTNYTGLTAGSIYYTGENGNPVLNGTSGQNKVYGVAMSSTKMYIK